jgi:hypothetical protein
MGGVAEPSPGQHVAHDAVTDQRVQRILELFCERADAFVALDPIDHRLEHQRSSSSGTSWTAATSAAMSTSSPCVATSCSSSSNRSGSSDGSSRSWGEFRLARLPLLDVGLRLLALRPRLDVVGGDPAIVEDRRVLDAERLLGRVGIARAILLPDGLSSFEGSVASAPDCESLASVMPAAVPAPAVV